MITTTLGVLGDISITFLLFGGVLFLATLGFNYWATGKLFFVHEIGPRQKRKNYVVIFGLWRTALISFGIGGLLLAIELLIQ